MTRRVVAVAATALALPLLTAAPVAAAPQAGNPNIASFPVTCAGEALTVSTIEQSSAAAVFGPDGRPLVAKSFAGQVEGTLTTETTSETFSSSFSDEGPRVDPSRLVTCTFTEEFTDEGVVVDQALLDELGLSARSDLIGQTADVAGTFTGTVGVLRPGRR